MRHRQPNTMWTRKKHSKQRTEKRKNFVRKREKSGGLLCDIYPSVGQSILDNTPPPRDEEKTGCSRNLVLQTDTEHSMDDTSMQQGS